MSGSAQILLSVLCDHIYLRQVMNMCQDMDVEITRKMMLGWVGFYGVSTFEGHLTPNPFLCK